MSALTAWWDWLTASAGGDDPSIAVRAVWIAGKAVITAAVLLIAGNLIGWPLVGLRAAGRAFRKGYNGGKERQKP